MLKRRFLIISPAPRRWNSTYTDPLRAAAASGKSDTDAISMPFRFRAVWYIGENLTDTNFRFAAAYRTAPRIRVQ